MNNFETVIIRKCGTIFVSDILDLLEQLEKNDIKSGIEKILELVEEGKHSFGELKESYDMALRTQKSNELFLIAHKLNSKYSVCVGEDISVLHTDESENNVFQDFLPWLYPYTIIPVCKNIGLDDHEVLCDVLNLNVASFFAKYFQTENIGISVDVHITLNFEDRGKIKHLYLSDSWFYDADEIMTDINTLSIIEFGEKYKAYWSP